MIADPSFLPVIYAAGEEDEWTEPAIWKKANPGLGITIKREYLARECEKAQQVPAYQNTFRRLHLNQWTQQESRWLDLTAWDACNGLVDAEDLEGRECYGGLDLASTQDVAAFALVFPPQGDGLYQVLPFFWIPEANMSDRARRDRVPYDAWVRDGLMTATPGNVSDYVRIVADIKVLAEHFRVREIAFDRWVAFHVQHQLAGGGRTLLA